jgi:hypothetical protein
MTKRNRMERTRSLSRKSDKSPFSLVGNEEVFFLSRRKKADLERMKDTPLTLGHFDQRQFSIPKILVT